MTDDIRKAAVVQHLELAILLGSTSEGLTNDEIAKALEVSTRTAQRMRKALISVFDIDESRDGRTIRYRISKSLPSAVLGVGLQELSDFEFAISFLESEGHSDRSDRLENLRNKVLAAMRATTRRQLEPDLELLKQLQLPIFAPGPRKLISDGVKDACQLAILAGRTLAFSYEAASGKSNHEVAPRGLLVGANSYLVGHIHDWGNPALFRLDRMNDARVTDNVAWAAEDFDIEAYAGQSFGVFQEQTHDVILRFDADVADEASTYSFHINQEFSTLADGRLEVRFHTGGLLELARYLVAWSNKVEVLQPEALKKLMKDEYTKCLSRL